MSGQKSNQSRILIIVEPAVDRTAYESKYVPLLIKHMNPEHFDIGIVASKRGSDSFQRLGIPVVGVGVGPRGFNGFGLVVGYMIYLVVAFFTALRFSKRMRPHVIMSLGGHTYSGLLATLLAKVTKSKSLVRIAGPTRFTLRSRYRMGVVFSAVAEAIEHWVFSNANVLISNSPLGSPMPNGISRKLLLVSQGVDTDLFRPSELKRNANERPSVITVCRLSREKRIRNMVLALRHLQSDFPGIELRIVGEGPERTNIEDLANRIGVSGQVCFIGYVPPREVPHLLRNSDVFVLPSKNESLPSAMLEAMACMTPTVIVQSWASKLQFQDGIHTIICEGSPQSIASSVHQILTDSNLRDKIVKRALTLVVSSHSIESARLKFEAILQSISGSSYEG